MIRRSFLKILSVISPAFTIKLNATENEAIVVKKTIEQLWIEYQQWLGEHFNQGLDTLNKGAVEHELTQLEAQTGNTLPNDYRAWLKVHNGQTSDSVGLLYSNEFLSVSRALDEWQLMKKLLDAGRFEHPSKSEPRDMIKQDWWNENWLPISADGSGNLVCIDFSPAQDGVNGQIIDFDHETVHRTVLARSFREYISNYIRDLELERYSYSQDYGRLLPLNDL